jgi:hypothetical protein
LTENKQDGKREDCKPIEAGLAANVVMTNFFKIVEVHCPYIVFNMPYERGSEGFPDKLQETRGMIILLLLLSHNLYSRNITDRWLYHTWTPMIVSRDSWNTGNTCL